MAIKLGLNQLENFLDFAFVMVLVNGGRVVLDLCENHLNLGVLVEGPESFVVQEIL